MSTEYIAIVYKEEDQYVSLVPELGTASCGSTIEEAFQNLKEATELYLELTQGSFNSFALKLQETYVTTLEQKNA